MLNCPSMGPSFFILDAQPTTKRETKGVSLTLKTQLKDQHSNTKNLTQNGRGTDVIFRVFAENGTRHHPLRMVPLSETVLG
jgi:hypothetical protein